MGRIAAIDYGSARIGIAITDERKILASPLRFLSSGKTLEESAHKLILELAPHGPIEELVVGLPLHLNGTEGAMAITIRKFVEILKTVFKIPIHLWDERLTTLQVERLLKSADVSRKKRAKITDSLSATLILQSYLDANSSV